MTAGTPPDSTTGGHDAQLPTPGLLRRLAAMGYDALLLIGVLFLATFAFLAVGRAVSEAWQRPLLQIYLLAVCGLYFGWFWMHGGQTLAMKTWRLRVTARNGGAVSLKRALLRYLVACVSLPAAGLGIWWALIDRDRQFLHDRLAGTRVVQDSGFRIRDSGKDEAPSP